MVMHHQTKFGCKQVRNLEDMVAIVISRLCKPPLALKLANRHFFPHDSPAHDDTPPYQACLQKAERFRRCRPDKIRTHGHTDTRTH